MSRFPRPGRTPRPRPVPTAGPTPSPTPGPGTTFTLTTGPDTATANVFNGSPLINGNFVLNTLNNGDRLTGSGANPTLNLTYNETGAAVTPALISNINTLNVDFTTFGGSTATAINWNNGSGLSAVSWSNAVAANSLNNISSRLNTLAVSNTGADQTFGFADAALVGAQDSISLTLNSVTGAVGAITLNTATDGASGYETVNVSSQGSVTNVASIATNAQGLTTLNVTGSAGFTTTNASANLTTFNASAATGAISYTAGGEGVASYTTGSAADVILLGDTYTSADTVNGGTGFDTLGITNPNAATNQVNVSNIDFLRIQGDPGAAVTYTPTFYGGATILGQDATFGAGRAITVTSTTPVSSYVFAPVANNAAGSLTVNVSGTGLSDVYNITSAAPVATDVITNVALNNVETANIINSNGGVAVGVATYQGTIALAPNIGGVSTLNVTGTNGVIVENNITSSNINASTLAGGGFQMITAGLVTTVTQVASNITGSAQADTLGGSASADIIVGGAGADRINGNGNADAIIGGAGFDQFAFSAAATDGDSGSLNNSSSYATIGDFFVGTSAGNTDLVLLSTAIGGANVLALDGTAVTNGETVAITSVAANTVVSVSSSNNLLKLTTPSTAAASSNGEAGFVSAIGLGSLTIGAASTGIPVVYYDGVNNQAILGLVASADATLTSADDFNVLSRIPMSAADYANFGNINFSAFNSVT